MPLYILPVFGAILGAIIGSFLATLVVRWPEGRSVMAGRSQCDNCGHQLRAMALIPVVSYLVQSGKCRQCGQKINPDHLAIEAMAAIIGATALFAVPGVAGFAGAILGWILLALAALDAKHHWLPDRLTFLLASSGLLATVAIPEPDIWDRLIGGVAGYMSLFLIAAAYRFVRKRDGLGGGDPKLLGAIGCWLGWTALPAVLLGASLIGLIAILRMKLTGTEITARSALPLGSFMAIAGFPIWLLQTAMGSSIFVS